jgi:hypothetical protein
VPVPIFWSNIEEDNMKTLMTKQPWVRYGMGERAFLYAYTFGYNSAYKKEEKNPYSKGSGSHKAWAKGKREAKLKCW